MTSLVGYEPCELGLPEKFEAFRPAQIEAADHALNSPYRFVPMALPLGMGKSLIAMMIAKASGLRTVILTATRGLQKQYETDLGASGLFNIWGRSNYQCAAHTNLDCRIGQLESCALIGQGCHYESQRDTARQLPTIVTNYAYWFHVNEYPPGLDSPELPVQQLICDESHQAVSELSKYLQTEIRESWLHTTGLQSPRQSEDISAWREFALNSIVAVGKDLSAATKTLKLAVTNRSSNIRRLRDKVYELDALKTSLGAISIMTAEDWVLEIREGTRHGRVWVFDNVWPAQHSFKLFRNIPKIILMSGTLRPSTLRLLGIPPSAYQFREWPRVFPAAHTPIYHIPTIKLNHKIDDVGLAKWVERIDEIIESRLDRKGIVHTVSYARQRYLLDHSRHAQYMLVNTNEPESESAAEVVTRFKASDAPAILVSPSFSTGWDFPGRCCEFQIIAKVPYPDIRSKIIQARLARIPSYASQLAMQDLEQACGRGTRSFSDRCEIFLIDDAIRYLLFRYPGLKSRWFSVIETSQVPPPGPRCPE